MQDTGFEFSATHSIVCNATAERVYGLIRRSQDWPQVLEPCASVTVIEEGIDEHGTLFEHIEIGAHVNGGLMSWRSRRRILPEVLGVEAEIVQPMTLVAAMRTCWRVVELSREQSVLLLEHSYDLCVDVTGQIDGVHTRDDAAQFIERAIDRNSTVELGNIKAAAELPAQAGPEHHMRHSVVCGADADTVYDVVRSTETWPRIFDACLSAAEVGRNESGVLVRIEALQNGGIVSWETHRTHHDQLRRIDYHLPVPMPFLESMQGQWRVVPLGPERSLLTVDRSWRMLPDVTGVSPGVDTVEQAAVIVQNFVSGNAAAEMHAIRAFVEDKTDALTSSTSQFTLPFPPDRVFAALADLTLWADAVPGHRAVRVHYDDGRHQELSAQWDTRAGAEDVRLVRHCDPEASQITWFFPQPLAVLRQHRGSWRVRAAGAGTELVITQVVLLDETVCTRAFGPELGTQKAALRTLLHADAQHTADACAATLPTPTR